VCKKGNQHKFKSIRNKKKEKLAMNKKEKARNMGRTF
jgi:hypothetical protein